MATPQTVMPQDLFKIAQTWQGGGYLTFFVSTIKKIIVSINTLNIYFPIVTTSFPDYKYRNKVA